MNILAIETSFDETAAAVIKDGTTILSSVLSSSSAVHRKYGGVVPEIAARKQLEFILPVIQETLAQTHTDYHYIDAIAVTIGPGLIGSLLVGVEAAKTIAFVTNKPIIPVNHVLAHMYANFLSSRLLSRGPESKNRMPDHIRHDKIITFPAISLVVSGGHTELYLMKSIKDLKWLGGTLDDAAGECFDKCARLLGFENRGGLAIQETALKYHPPDGGPNTKDLIKLPRPMIHEDSLNFSFSGLKTAVIRLMSKLKASEQLDNLPAGESNVMIQQLSHEIQEAITDVLITKTLKAAQIYQAKSILLSGGVAANLRLREKFNTLTTNLKLPTFFPPVELCTDNATFIGCYAYFRGQPINWKEITAVPDLSVEKDN